MKYEDLSDAIKANLGQGYVLANHTVFAGTHLTTVELAAAHDEFGRAIAYCAECDDRCEPGSVELIVLDYPGTENTEPTADSVAQQRLEFMKSWLYERCRNAIHAGNELLVRTHLASLFVLTTGVEPGQNNELYGRFAEFLVDSVINDVEVMPEFPMVEPSAEPDCGH